MSTPANDEFDYNWRRLRASPGGKTPIDRVAELGERQKCQLDKLATLAASIYRSPAVTTHERHPQQTLFGLLLDAAEESCAITKKTSNYSR
ncbi:hypothetical protein [Paraburkholderia ribeironis]|uniref:hypothetical protein n=1 Tax=Paraburkholderia ribeironis TaxID=1247936 RepID=UPI0011780E05|nr:hypothetical protein [Paraburkholderia ribeironis]